MAPDLRKCRIGGEDHALPSPVMDRQATATELLEGILARDGAAVSATTTGAVATSPETQLQDAVIRYADALALATTKVRVDLDEAPVGPLPWLAGVPDEVADLPAWGPCLTARARRVSTLADEVRTRSVLPEWMHRFDDVLTSGLRGDLAVWRAAVGVIPDDRTLAGPPPTDDHEAAYHRRLTRTIDARYGDALRAWESRIIEYVDRRDEYTIEFAKHLDQLQRRGVDAERMLDLAAARKPLPTDHPTAALAYRVRELAFENGSRRYERREKSPSLAVTERLIGAAGYSLRLDVTDDFSPVTFDGQTVYQIPNRLWRVEPRLSFSKVKLPDWPASRESGDFIMRNWDLAVREERRRVYGYLLRESVPAWIYAGSTAHSSSTCGTSSTSPTRSAGRGSR